MAERQDMERDEVSSDEIRKILELALERPGVKEMMSVYQNWDRLQRAAEPYHRVSLRKRVVATADTSERMILHTAV